MTNPQDVSSHYTHGNLVAAIRDGLAALGKAPGRMSIDDLAPVDEFHIGGRRASEDFLGQLGFGPDHHVLDVGCGLGGSARFVASRYGSHVTGIDLTPEYVETGRALTGWVGLHDRVVLRQGSALALPFGEGSFDGAYMIHVGMNIRDKATLCAEVARILRPGTMFGIYDVMRTGEGELAFPLPWAMRPSASAVDTPADYRAALERTGLRVTAERARRDFALAFFDQVRARTAAAGGPPPLGLHLLMGRTTAEKVQNMVDNITAGRIAPVEIIARKAR